MYSTILKLIRSVHIRLKTAAKIDDLLAKSKLPLEEQLKIRRLNELLKNKTKYIPFLIKYYQEPDIVYLINKFDIESNKSKLAEKDINKYTIERLRNELNMLTSVRTPTELKKEGSEKIYEDDNWTVYKISTPEASIQYGAGTKWCISSNKPQEASYFYDYHQDANIYFVISKNRPKEDPLYKIAVLSNPINIKVWDSIDRVIPSDILETLNIPINIFKPPTTDELTERYIKRYLIKNSDNTYSSNKNILVPPILVENGRFKIKFKDINGTFDCSYLGLTSLEGAPKKVTKDFICHNNKLSSLKGAPKFVGGNFNCKNNSKKFTKEEILEVSEVKGSIIT